MIDHNKQLNTWLNLVNVQREVQQAGFSSIEFEDMMPRRNGPDISQIVAASFQIFTQAIDIYKPICKEYLLELEFDAEWADTLEKHSFEDLLQGVIVLRQPPEIYITKRNAEANCEVREEYICALQQEQDRLRPSYGKIYAYYKTTQDMDDDIYTQTFAFRHVTL